MKICPFSGLFSISLVTLIFAQFASGKLMSSPPSQPATAPLVLDPQTLLSIIRSVSSSPQNISGSCLGKFKYMVNHPVTDPAIIAFFSGSGKGLNELGDYMECTGNPETRYILLTISGLPMAICLGICGPAECRKEDYDALRQDVASLLNDTISKIIPKDSTFKVNIRRDNVVFNDVAKTTKEGTAIGLGLVLTLTILGLLVLACIISTVYFMGKDPDQKKGTLQRVAHCFDLGKTYGQLLIDDARHDQTLKVFDGIRVLSMVWIVYGHSYNVALGLPMQNPQDISTFVSEFSKAHLYNATYSVDVFFFLSGFFLTFIALQQLARGSFTWQIYLHRLIRLYPALLVTFFADIYILPALGDGPIYGRVYGYPKKCYKIWHYVLLFMYNLRERGTDCIGWVWYLSNDFQLFVFTPPILWLMNKSRKLGLVVLMTILCISFAVQFPLAYKYNHSSNVLKQNDDYNRFYYVAPWARCPTYIIGILAGYLYVQYKSGKTPEGNFLRRIAVSFKSSSLLRAVFYAVGLVGMFITIHAVYWITKYSATMAQTYDIVYVIFSRTVFVVFMVVLVLPQILGAGSWLKSLLANRAMAVVAKLTYGQYLLHVLIITHGEYRGYRSQHFEYKSFMLMSWGFIVFSYLCAFAMCLFVELPLFNLEAEFLRPRKRAIQPAKSEAEDKPMLKH